MAKKKRPRRDPDEPDLPGVSSCQVCGGNRPGHVYEFWTGHKERMTETRMYDATTRIKAVYSDMKMIHSFVCDRCVAAVRRKAYLLRFVAWGVVFLLSLIVLAAFQLSGIDQASKLVCGGVFGVLAIPTGLFVLYYAWQMFGPVRSSPTTDKLVLSAVRLRRPYERGYDYFTTAEYEDHFNREDK